MKNNTEQFLRERCMVFLQKNKDYGDSFKLSLDKHGRVAALVRMEDKVNRFKQLRNNVACVQDEKILDTVLDLFNYLAMFEAWLEEDYRLTEIALQMDYLVNNDGSAFHDLTPFDIFRKKLVTHDIADEETAKYIQELLLEYVEKLK